jgi:hypothetical protein
VTTTTVAVEGAAETNVLGGVEVASSNDNLNLGESWEQAESELTDSDFPDLLADGIVEDDDENDEIEYSQEIQLQAGPKVEFGRDDDDLGDDPMLYLDFQAGMAYKLDVDFAEALDITALNDNEEIELFGITWTFDNDIGDDDDVVLYGSDITATVNVGETITLAGVEISVTGANTDSNTAIIVVNGATKQVEEGDYVTVGGTQLYVKNIFLQTIPVESAAVEFFIGSTEMTLPACTGASGEDIELDGDTIDGVTFSCTGDNNATEEWMFEVTPADMDDDLDRYLVLGGSFVDPLFGTFEVNFAGAVPPLAEAPKLMAEFKVNGDELQVTATNEDGDEYTFSPYELDANDRVTNQTEWIPIDAAPISNIDEDDWFITEKNGVSKVLMLDRVFSENSVDKVTFEDLTDGSKRTYTDGQTVKDTNCVVDAIDTGNDQVDLTGCAATSVFEAKNDWSIDLMGTAPYWDNSSSESAAGIEITEGFDQSEDELVPELITFEITDGVRASTSDWDLGIQGLAGNTTTTVADDDNEWEYLLTPMGTYAEFDDEDNTMITFWYPFEDEAYYQVFFAPTGAKSVTSGGASGVETELVNPIGVGAAVMDSDAPSADTANLIVVGGPCANTVAARLMGNPANCAEGFVEGKAKIKLFSKANDHVSIVVAGYSAIDTQGASRVLANYEDYDLMDDEVEVTVTDLATLTVAAPTVEAPDEPAQ